MSIDLETRKIIISQPTDDSATTEYRYNKDLYRTEQRGHMYITELVIECHDQQVLFRSAEKRVEKST